jgi:hypothetical protein
VLILESSGVPADDTTVTIAAGERRVVVLRRGAPDNSLFAEVIISGRPADTVSPAAPAESLTVRLQPRPGIYGLDIQANGPIGSEVRVTFSDGLQFVAPAGALARYGTELGFEQALWVARVDPDGLVVFLPSTRPGSDLLSAAVGGVGRYVVAAPGRG